MYIYIYIYIYIYMFVCISVVKRTWYIHIRCVHVCSRHTEVKFMYLSARL